MSLLGRGADDESLAAGVAKVGLRWPQTLANEKLGLAIVLKGKTIVEVTPTAKYDKPLPFNFAFGVNTFTTDRSRPRPRFLVEPRSLRARPNDLPSIQTLKR